MKTIATDEFIHLRAQSSYSMLASMIKIDELADIAKANYMSAVALTDKANLFGSLEFSINASKKAIQPIHGVLLELCYNEEKKKFAEILLIAKNKNGYKNLLKLTSFPYIKNPRTIKEHITWNDLTEHNQGLIILSGYTDGPIGKELIENRAENAEQISEKFKSIFGDRFYFEIFRHNQSNEIKIEADYLKLAQKLEIPIVATNKVLFPKKEMHQSHDVLLCIAEGATKEQENRKYVPESCYFKSSREMKQLFHDLPSAIENACYIAQRCSIKAEEKDPILPTFAHEMTEEELLTKQATEGLKKRLEDKFNFDGTPEEEREQKSRPYYKRLAYELEIITKMNFAGYFLIVSDFIMWSKQQEINVGPGRGSGAASIVAWSLLITDLDPIRFGLIFERFLNPERVSMPDFDIDFCQERREEVINYVRTKYGDSRVAQIITFGKLQAKAVIKDVSRVLGLRYEIADYLTELVPFNAVNPVTLSQAVVEVQELKEAYKGKGLYDYKKENELIKQVLDTSLDLEGLHRHSSVHAAGIVISGEDLIKLLPLYKDINGDMSIIQYSMKYAEAAGLVKFDFLGLQTLTVISKSIELIRQNGTSIDLSKISFKDEITYQMLSKGTSSGVFQFESPGMKDTLRKLKPDCIEDLMALGALYRPGPMDNIPVYIACKHKRQKPDYLHPKLKPILQETYGVIVYQEQVLEIAKVLAGYSLGSADLLRRAMGKKIKSEMEDQKKMFIEGAKKNGIPEDQAKDIFTSVAKFAGYGFNRAHAASYGVISYYTAYLKANYPVEFLVACLNLDISDYDKINLFIEEARHLKIEVIPPDVNESEGFFSIKHKKNGEKIISYGLGAIRNVSVNFGKEVENERKRKGSFKTLTDFVQRISNKHLTKRSLEGLIKAGGFDSIYQNRKSIFESTSRLLAYSARHNQDKLTQQVNIFSTEQDVQEIIEEVPDFSHLDKSMLELEVLGRFSKNHYLDKFIAQFKLHKITPIIDLENKARNGSDKLKIAGVILKKDARMSPRGRFITLLLSDPTGNCDITIYSEKVMKDYSNLITTKSAVIAECETFKDEGGIRLTGLKFFDIDEFSRKNLSSLNLKIEKESDLEKLINLLESKQSKNAENAKVNVQMKYNNIFNVKFAFSSKHDLSIDDYNKIKHLIKQ